MIAKDQHHMYAWYDAEQMSTRDASLCSLPVHSSPNVSNTQNECDTDIVDYYFADVEKESNDELDTERSVTHFGLRPSCVGGSTSALSASTEPPVEFRTNSPPNEVGSVIMNAGKTIYDMVHRFIDSSTKRKQLYAQEETGGGDVRSPSWPLFTNIHI